MTRGCTHTRERSAYDPVEQYDGSTEYEWRYWTEHTTRDIGIGAYQCTQCGEVMYYTGSWKKHYTEDTPCPGSTLTDPAETSRVKEAIKTKDLQKERRQ